MKVLRSTKVRSVLAVLAGLVVIVAVSNGLDTVLEQTGVFPSIDEQRASGFDTPWMLALALAYRAGAAVLGGYLTARLAPNQPRKHVIALIVVGFLLGALGSFATDGVTPLWFLIAVLILTPAFVWLGGQRLARPRAAV